MKLRSCTFLSYAFYESIELAINIQVKLVQNCKGRYDEFICHTSKTKWQHKSFSHLIPLLEENNIRYNRDWLAIGCQYFKPAMILSAMEASEGNIIYYHDSNWLKYTSYGDNFALGKQRINSLLGKHDICLFFNGHKSLSIDVKRWLLNHFGFDNHLKYNGLWAGALIIRNCKASKDFIALWNLLCNDQDFVSPYPDVKANEIYSDFLWHSCDQACLNIAYHTYRNSKNLSKSISIRILNAGSKRQIPSEKFQIALSYFLLVLSTLKFNVNQFVQMFTRKLRFAKINLG